jgi:16S rRNA (cytidine1402-2'-O)-methyltransferase
VKQHRRGEKAETPQVTEKGALYVIGVPIGNLADITLRGLDTLRAVDVIATEDTRKSRILLDHYGISGRLVSLHKLSEARKTADILDLMASGQAVALITDAGTPCISDPGHRLIARALDAGFTVHPIPGPSSLISALSVSGADCTNFVYLGFVPKTSGARRAFFEALVQERRTTVWFETALRVVDSLRIAAEFLAGRTLAVAREMTKLHEEILRGELVEVLGILEARDSVKGELALTLEGASRTGSVHDPRETVRRLIREGFHGKDLITEAHVRYGIRKKDAYTAFLALSGADTADDDETL